MKKKKKSYVDKLDFKEDMPYKIKSEHQDVYDYYVMTPEGRAEVKEMVQDGYTEAMIANNLGISSSLFDQWKLRVPDFRKFLDMARGELDAEVEKTLYQRALGYTYKDVKYEYRKDKDTGKWEKVAVEAVEKTALPDVRAIKFWLQNRRPSHWVEKAVVQHKGLLDDRKSIEDIAGMIESSGIDIEGEVIDATFSNLDDLLEEEEEEEESV